MLHVTASFQVFLFWFFTLQLLNLHDIFPSFDIQILLSPLPSLTGRADGHLVIYNHFILFCISSFFSYINFTARSGHESNRTRNHFYFVTYQELCKPIQLRQQTRRRDANAGNFIKFFTFAACGNALRNSARNFQMSAIFDQNFQVHHYEFPKASSIPNLAIAFLFVEINQQKLLGALLRWFHQLFFQNF